MSAKRGLGRNLSALLHQANLTESSTDAIADQMILAIAQLQPGKYQPRAEMDEASLAELAESIKKQGLLQPIIVRALPQGGYEIIAGERRWRACQMAGKTEIPVVVRQVDDETAMAMALVENLQREDLNAMDQARAMHRLVLEFGFTHEQVAELLCKSRAAVSNYLRLLQLSPDVSALLERGELDMGHARCLLQLETYQQVQVARLVVAKQLSVRETEALVARVKAEPLMQDKSIHFAPLFSDELDVLARQFQTKIKLKPGKAGKGTLVIHYEDEHNLKTVINRLLCV